MKQPRLSSWSRAQCQTNPCSNGGTCQNTVNGYNCYCPLGFTGSLCQTQITQCTSSSCKNGATCVENPPISFSCVCLPGYTGYDCSIIIDQYEFTLKFSIFSSKIKSFFIINRCQTIPCQNGALCDSYVNYYVCTCLPGYTGANCEFKIEVI